MDKPKHFDSVRPDVCDILKVPPIGMFSSDTQITERHRENLRTLRDLFCVDTIYKDEHGLYIMAPGKTEKIEVRIPSGNYLIRLFDKDHPVCISIFGTLQRRD